MKKILALTSAVILSLALSSCTSKSDESASDIAATPSVIEICEPTTAVGHEPLAVEPPTEARSNLPKTFTFITNCGDIEITTVGSKAPFTLTSLATLAEAGFYDDSLCHRLTTQGLYVLQCGDPTATGSGGPTYSVADENLPQQIENNYPAGTVAMANSGPNTNGSQFFLVFDDTTLGANYTIWGEITQGLDIVKAIAAAGVVGGAGDGTPLQSVQINKVVVK